MSFMDYVKSPFKMGESFFNPEKGYDKAERAMQEYWQKALGYMQPYNQAGIDQISKLTDAQGRLLDPVSLQNEWSQAYQTSPEAQDLMERSRKIGEMEASSMGLAGSGAALENIQRTGSSIVAQDRQNFLNDLMKKYMTAIGIGTDIYGAGANMGANMGRGALSMGANIGEMEFGKQNAPGKRLGDIIGMTAPLLTGGAGGAKGGGATL
jgi:hypothetical protein